jgi:hypothetical protein
MFINSSYEEEERIVNLLFNALRSKCVPLWSVTLLLITVELLRVGKLQEISSHGSQTNLLNC